MHLTSAPPYEHSEAVTMSDIDNVNANSPDALLRRCTKCGETKPCAGFSKNKTERDGLQRHCKSCAAKYRLENAGEISEYGAQYRIKNASKVREKNARWRSENPDKAREGKARWQRENPDKVRAADARWQQANLDKVRAKEHRRRATKRALPVQWSDTDIQRMLVYWGNRCAICNQHVEPNNAFYFLAADHWIALTSPECPGTVPCNILPLCHSKICSALGCNNSKSNADPIAWLNSRYPDDPKLVAKILARIAKYFKTVTDGAL